MGVHLNEDQRITRLLKEHPRGMSITELSAALTVNRNSVAKYLDVLQTAGRVELRTLGPAKLYFLSSRVPASALLDHSHDAIILYDAEKVILANENALALLGTTRDALLGRPLAALLTPEQLAAPLAGKQATHDARLGPKHLDLTLLPTTFDDGSTGATLIAKDVTAEKEAEAENELLRRAIDASSCGITIADAAEEDLPLIYVNPAFERITGYRKAEILGKNCRFLQGDDRDQEAIATVRHALAHGEECTVKLRNYRKDGTPFWNELHIAPVKHDGKVTHYVGVQTVLPDP